MDLVIAVPASVMVAPIIVAAWCAASVSTGANGFFVQRRVGRNGTEFPLIKLRSMRQVDGFDTTVTAKTDPRITRVGAMLRRTKLDELPQLFNVVAGHMSLVGPRPDVADYSGTLTGEDRIVLSVRPGITGPASLRFRDEESLLALQPDPDDYNRRVIWPEKVAINRRYVEQWSFRKDLRYLIRTVWDFESDDAINNQKR